MAVGPDRRVWVTDTANHRVRVYDSTLGSFETFGKPGAGPGGFSRPVEVDSDGSLCVTDPGSAGAVLHLDGEGQVVQTRTAGSRAESLSLPTGLAVNREDRILYVVNRGNNSVSQLLLATANKP